MDAKQVNTVYQVYPKSFQDSDGDGVGDLRGIIGRLDYLEWLGIDMVWLNPVYVSPGYDNGYDVADYARIDPMFGSMEDMDELIRKAKDRGIGIMMDIVANHTSHQHDWFLQSERDPEGAYGDFYIWRDTPNEWSSFFGGGTWTYSPVRGQYYFHAFAPEQPDLNWGNEQVRTEMAGVLAFWAERGVTGFRFDVIDLIGKDVDRKRWLDFPLMRRYLKDLVAQVDASSMLLVGEAGGLTRDEILALQRDGSLDVVFNFEVCALDEQVGQGKWKLASFEPSRLKATLDTWQRAFAAEGRNSLFWNNHDQPRAISRWYDGDERAAKMLAVLLYGLKGIPFLYQGEEVGMTNGMIAPEDYQDVETLNYLGTGGTLDAVRMKGRDHARLPMAWGEGADTFSTGTPWLRSLHHDEGRDVSTMRLDETSLLHLYRELIALRRTNRVLRDGAYELVPTEDHLYVYRRFLAEETPLLVVVNLSPDTVPIPVECGDRLIATEQVESPMLRPYEAFICYNF
ncbi:alpha-glucosidase [Exiguobacterium aurantiacum]|uniref:alpha-glucosidase n=1 Tax=Exiguobacterium aurantiacum TaxID=33987 RepID=UPI000877924A|nr:alpha-glucosidase [Exiguobacterium aurantiacum]